MDLVGMKKPGAANPSQPPRRMNKSGLAVRYDVGIRTIENWQYVGIIHAHFEQGQAVFDVADCDQRLLNHKNKSRAG
jgi:hypothetical protein